MPDSMIDEVEQYIHEQNQVDLLRFITCGSVDDGKSTLIGRLLFEAKMLMDDQLAALELDSQKAGANAGELDFSMLLDGLVAEREQGITIDVAYRYFCTDRRSFIVADTPGHEQYTRNMVTGATTADVAVILVDATQGLLTQTRRHSFVVSLLGVKRVVVAVNKMDLVEYRADVFADIEQAYRKFAQHLDFEAVELIPISALIGDNVTERSAKTSWYKGPTLLGYLETVPVGGEMLDGKTSAEDAVAGESRPGPFRFPVQWVNRPNANFRGYAGTIVAGTIKPGDSVRVLPSGNTTRIAGIHFFNKKLPMATAGQAVTLTLDSELDVTRGDVLVQADEPCEVSDQFEVTLIWMDQEQGYIGRNYGLMIGTMQVSATISEIKYKYNINTFEQLSSRSLGLNDIAVVTLNLSRPVPFEPYNECKALGAFVLLDRYTQNTVAGGMIKFALRRAANVHRQALVVDKAARARLNGHPGRVIWFTGLSGSGKSTIANSVEQRLYARGYRTYILDGDNVRHGLNKDLGFTDADRIENIRRIGEVARLMVDAGVVVLTAFISPFRSERDMARSLFDEGEFAEVFVDVTLETAEQRDPKGLYKKARRGELPNFTGIDSAYESPEQPDLVLDTGQLDAEACADLVVHMLEGSFESK